MRNLKRALSLALASVMLMGMMVVGSSAKDFGDMDTVANKDAVAVLGAIGIFEGTGDGNFEPTKIVTRAEMAVIVCKMMYGEDVNTAAYAAQSVFTDVPAWAAGYVNMAASLGITAGVGNNKFDPNAPVTTAQAALMLSKALGYFDASDANAYASGWELAAITTARGLEFNMFGDMKLNPKEGLTRDNVAEMTFNALRNSAVSYNVGFEVYYNGTSFIGGIENVGAAGVESLLSDNFGDLKVAPTTDDMGRPATEYKLDNKEVATIAVDADNIYTSETKVTTIDKNAEEVMKASDNVVLNGKSNVVADLKNIHGGGTKSLPGIVIEVYDETGAKNDETIYVAYTYAVGKVTRVVTDDDDREVVVAGKKFETTEFAKGDMVTYTMADGDIFSMMAAETVVGEVDTVATAYVGIDGTDYDYADGVTDIKDTKLGYTYTLYLDPNGYVLDTDEGEKGNTIAGDYLVVEAADEYLGTVKANVVLSDGTEKEIVIDQIDDADADTKLTALKATYYTAGAGAKVYSYSVSNGKYDLTTETTGVALTTTYDIKEDDYRIYNDAGVAVGSTYLTEDTVFVDVENGKTYVGNENVPAYTDMANAQWVKDGNNVEIMFINDDPDTATNDYTYAYIDDASDSSTKRVDGKTVTVYNDAYVDGVETEVMVLSSVVTAVGGIGSDILLQITKTNDEGVATAVSKLTSGAAKAVTSVGNDVFFTDGRYEVTDDSVIVYVTTDGGKPAVDVYTDDMDDMFVSPDKDGSTCAVYVAQRDDNDVLLAYVFIDYN